jgi:hypothetical protein
MALVVAAQQRALLNFFNTMDRMHSGHVVLARALRVLQRAGVVAAREVTKTLMREQLEKAKQPGELPVGEALRRQSSTVRPQTASEVAATVAASAASPPRRESTDADATNGGGDAASPLGVSFYNFRRLLAGPLRAQKGQRELDEEAQAAAALPAMLEAHQDFLARVFKAQAVAIDTEA